MFLIFGSLFTQTGASSSRFYSLVGLLKLIGLAAMVLAFSPRANATLGPCANFEPGDAVPIPVKGQPLPQSALVLGVEEGQVSLRVMGTGAAAGRKVTITCSGPTGQARSVDRALASVAPVAVDPSVLKPTAGLSNGSIPEADCGPLSPARKAIVQDLLRAYRGNLHAVESVANHADHAVLAWAAYGGEDALLLARQRGWREHQRSLDGHFTIASRLGGGDAVARLFVSDRGEAVLAFRGTTTDADWATNLGMVLPVYSDQMRSARVLAERARTLYPQVSFVGHSLGGAMAQVARLQVDRAAVIFNSAPVGLHALGMALSGQPLNVRVTASLKAFRSPEDPVRGATQGLGDFEDVVVNNIVLTGNTLTQNALDAAAGTGYSHSMSVLARAMQEVRLVRDEGWLLAKFGVTINVGHKLCGFELTEESRIKRGDATLGPPIVVTRSSNGYAYPALSLKLSAASPSGRFRLLSACDRLVESGEMTSVIPNQGLCWRQFLFDEADLKLTEISLGRYGPHRMVWWNSDESMLVAFVFDEGVTSVCGLRTRDGVHACHSMQKGRNEVTAVFVDPSSLVWMGPARFRVEAQGCGRAFGHTCQHPEHSVDLYLQHFQSLQIDLAMGESMQMQVLGPAMSAKPSSISATSSSATNNSKAVASRPMGEGGVVWGVDPANEGSSDSLESNRDFIAPFLSFPLRCWTKSKADDCDGSAYKNGAYTVASPDQIHPGIINSVLDHQMEMPYGVDGCVLAFTGELRCGAVHKRQGAYPNMEISASPISVHGLYRGDRDSNFRAGLNYEGHPGYDFYAELGAPVYAAAPGRIVEYNGDQCIPKGLPDGCGAWGFIGIDHGNGYVTQYGHLSRIFKDVGEPVFRGEMIGEVGSTAPKTAGAIGAHLHFEVLKSGSCGMGFCVVDPYGWEGSPSGDLLGKVTGIRNVRLWLKVKSIDSAGGEFDEIKYPVLWNYQKEPDWTFKLGEGKAGFFLLSSGESQYQGGALFPASSDPASTELHVYRSPKGRYALVEQKDMDWGVLRIAVVDLEDGRIVTSKVIPNRRVRGQATASQVMQAMSGVSWSPDSLRASVALSSAEWQADLLVISLASGQSQLIAPSGLSKDFWAFPRIKTIKSVGLQSLEVVFDLLACRERDCVSPRVFKSVLVNRSLMSF